MNALIAFGETLKVCLHISKNPKKKEKTAESVGLSQIITEKLTQLEKQMEACSQTIREIKELTKQS